MRLKHIKTSVQHLFQRNHNNILQAKNIVHKRTKYPINEDKAMRTVNKMLGPRLVIVTYYDGVETEFNQNQWIMFGAQVLKNTVIKKIVW